ncbi:MAG: hypothetical protein JJ992_25570, partial [Planctomycetes bacterium]|nr:hypothetical protein [Planctomycetota bacterium]
MNVQARLCDHAWAATPFEITARTSFIFASSKKLFRSISQVSMIFLIRFFATSSASRSVGDQPDQSMDSQRLYQQASEAAGRHDSRRAV